MRRAGLCLAGTVLLAGCVSASPHADLNTDLAKIIAAADSHNPVALRSAVGDFELELDAELLDHRLTDAQHSQLRALAERVANGAGSLAVATISPTAPAPTLAPPSPTQQGKDKKKKGGDNGNGNGGGSEGDPGPSPLLPPVLIGGSPSDSPSPADSASPQPTG